MTDPLRDGDPAHIGSYRLHARLGGGGMGEVFLGRSPGGRLVAVKVVRPELADNSDFRRRFTSEVDAARKVGGFYTAQVVDADTDAVRPWLATAYIPGPSLHRAVDEHGPLPVESAAVLGAGLAEGLAAVHACGMVHRDLKPGNVILAEDGPRLIDFGIARALDGTSHTQTSTVLGTAAFMSPEQAMGREVGPPSDVFSLGCVLAFAVTGRSPFGTGPVHAVVFRVVHAEPDLQGVPAPLAALVAACLAKDPAARPSLEQVLTQLTALASPDQGRWLPEALTQVIADRRTLALTTLHDLATTTDGGGPRTMFANPTMCTFQTFNIGHYLTAVGGGGQTGDVIHTDATVARSWERFTLVDAGDGVNFGIKTVTGHFLAAVGGGGRTADVIHSDATLLQAWEKFALIPQGDDVYAIRTITGHFLTAVGGGGRTTDVIHSDATLVQSWEKFRVRAWSGGSFTGTGLAGRTISLR
ncbi:protein kinase [Nonomuraea sp. NPDC005692]|uniref:protein kinase domain-containing protein n=1 Tax=Nonomuraea sp. NPDC005692 TaxID=3157168 RepID=UPI0033D209DD